MFTEEAIALLEGGSALIVGLTRPDGRPLATRGAALDLGDDGSAVLLVATEDAARSGLEHGTEPDAAIAVTAVNVASLTSVQVKGRVLAVEPGGPADLERKDRYYDEFCERIHVTDGTPVEVIERWRPQQVVRCRLVLDELFVQTPGPGAGASLGPVAG